MIKAIKDEVAIKECLKIVANFMKEDFSPKSEIKEFCSAIKKIISKNSYDNSTYTFMLWDALGVDGLELREKSPMIERVYQMAGKSVL